MLAHDGMEGRLGIQAGGLMQRRDVTEADEGFGDRRHPIDDSLQSVPASRTEDNIHLGIIDGIHYIRQTMLICSGKTSPRVTRVRALAHYISPRAQARCRPVDKRRVDDS